MGSLARWSKEDPCGVSAALVKNNQEIRYPLSLPLDISVMADDFAHSQNHRRKISVLRDRGYELFRRVRGDGNCFYRAMGVAWIEALLTLRSTSNPFRDQDPRGMLLDTSLADWPDRSEFRELADQYQELLEVLDMALSADDEKAAQASEHLRKQLLADTKTDLCLVLLVRLLIARACLQLGSEDDVMQAFAAIHGGLQKMIETQVLPLGEEAESATAVCASRVFRTRLHIVQLDSSTADQLPEYVYPSEDYESPLGIHITLLFRPGHYDILYGPSSTILNLRREWLLDTSFSLRARCSCCQLVEELPADGLLVCGHRICHSCQLQVPRGRFSTCPRCSGHRPRLGQEVWEDATADQKLMPLQSTAQPHETEKHVAAAVAPAAESAQAAAASVAEETSEAQQSSAAESQAMEVDQEGEVSLEKKCHFCPNESNEGVTGQLPCAHWLCSSCLQDHLVKCVSSALISCPGAGCKWHLKEEDLPKLEETLPKEVYMPLLHAWFQKQERMRPCTHPGCTERVFVPAGLRPGKDVLVCQAAHGYSESSRQHSDQTSRPQEHRELDFVTLGPTASAPPSACDGCGRALAELRKLACGHQCCGGCRTRGYSQTLPCCLGKSRHSVRVTKAQETAASRSELERRKCKYEACAGWVEVGAGADYTAISCTQGHSQCLKCNHGPHRGQSCATTLQEHRRNKVASAPAEGANRRSWPEWAEELISDFKIRPCPMFCENGWVGIDPSDRTLGFVTCRCGFEFCLHCGANAKVIRAHHHDPHYHKFWCATRPYGTSLTSSSTWPAQGCPNCIIDNYGRRIKCQPPESDEYPKKSWYVKKVRELGESYGSQRRSTSLAGRPARR